MTPKTRASIKDGILAVAAFAILIAAALYGG